MHWQVQEAKQRFSEVVRAAEAGEPQIITKHGAEVVVIVDISEYNRYHGRTQSLMSYLRADALTDIGIELDVTRERELPREVDLVG